MQAATDTVIDMTLKPNGQKMAWCDDGKKRPVSVADGFYVCEGKKLPRVSRVLDVYPGTYYSKRATDVGTAVHECIEAALYGLTIDLPDHLDTIGKQEAAFAFEGFVQWYAAYGGKLPPLEGPDGLPLIETTFFSESLGYAGTGDLAVAFDGPVLIDWKTGALYRKKYAHQLICYAAGLKRTIGIEFKEAVAIRFEKSAKKVAEQGAPRFEAFKIERRHFKSLWGNVEAMLKIHQNTMQLQSAGLPI